MWEGGKDVKAFQDLVWTGDLLRATVYINATGPWNITAQLFLNNGLAARHEFLSESTVWRGEYDVQSLLKSGRNDFMFQTLKTPTLGWGPVDFSVSLYAETSGEFTVNQKTVPDWMRYLQYGLLGVTVIGGVAVVGMVLTRKQRGPRYVNHY